MTSLTLIMRVDAVYDDQHEFSVDSQLIWQASKAKVQTRDQWNTRPRSLVGPITLTVRKTWGGVVWCVRAVTSFLGLRQCPERQASRQLIGKFTTWKPEVIIWISCTSNLCVLNVLGPNCVCGRVSWPLFLRVMEVISMTMPLFRFSLKFSRYLLYLFFYRRDSNLNLFSGLNHVQDLTFCVVYGWT